MSTKTKAAPGANGKAAQKTNDKDILNLAQAAGKPVEIPDWVHDTPHDNSYELSMFQSDGEELQQICMSRAEFDELKEHLARMRGYIPAEERSTPNDPPKTESKQGVIECKYQGEFDYLNTCRQIRVNNEGCNTPFEEFFIKLVRNYDFGHTDVETVAQDFDEFEQGWEDMAKTFRILGAKNPGFIRAIAAELEKPEVS